MTRGHGKRGLKYELLTYVVFDFVHQVCSCADYLFAYYLSVSDVFVQFTAISCAMFWVVFEQDEITADIFVVRDQSLIKDSGGLVQMRKTMFNFF